MPRMKSLEISPYYKAGTDMQEHLAHAKGEPARALAAWAEQMEQGAARVRKILAVLGRSRFEVAADTHMVSIHSDAKTEARLRKSGLMDVG